MSIRCNGDFQKLIGISTHFYAVLINLGKSTICNSNNLLQFTQLTVCGRIFLQFLILSRFMAFVIGIRYGQYVYQ